MAGKNLDVHLMNFGERLPTVTMRKLRIFSATRRYCLLRCGSILFCCFRRRRRARSRNRSRTKSFDLPTRRPDDNQTQQNQKNWRKILWIGTFIFCLYSTLLGFVTYLAITNNRNTRLQFQLAKKNRTILETVYGSIGKSGNGSFVFGDELITIERVGGSSQNKLYATFVQDMLRSHTIFKCVSVHFRKELKTPVALVSFPGSGNTWLRYLLQLATGIFTGSVYKDIALLRNGFPGESVTDGRVLVVKTHEIGLHAHTPFQKAILLLRKPSEAILAEFNRREAGHIGRAGRERYKRNRGIDWSQFVAQTAKSWTETNLDWIEHFNGSLLITMYSHLVQNTPEELVSILNFLEEPVTDNLMKCVLRNKEGIYRREKGQLNFNPFTPPMERFLDLQERIVARAIQRRIAARQTQIQRLRKIGAPSSISRL